jgi:uncharacterized protein
MQQIVRTLPAPEDLGVEMIGVPKDADVELSLRLEAVMEGVLVTGTARAPLQGECVRCLDPLTSQVEVGFQELYFYSAEDADEDDQVLDGELLDLEPTFRDAVVLSLPLDPVCREDCPGLCVECGVKLAEADADHGHEPRVDVRWAALKELKFTTDDDQEG